MCSTSWCSEKPRTRNMCVACYSAWYKGHDPEQPRRRKVPKDATDEDRLRSYGWTVTESGCWEWDGRRDKKGYGVLCLHAQRQVFAHRTAFAVWVGELDPKLSVCHRCDNPPCINPEHLWQGTERDNKVDMATKGRGNTARLTPLAVQELRALYTAPFDRGLVPRLAKQYGVSTSAIRAVLHGRTWKNV